MARQSYRPMALLFLVLAIFLFTIVQAVAAPNYTVTRITNNYFDDKYPQINNQGHVVWQGSNASHIDLEIYLYNGTNKIPITDDTFGDWDPKINDEGFIVWERGGDGPDREIMLGSSTEWVLRSCLVWTVNALHESKREGFLTAVAPGYSADGLTFTIPISS